MDPHTKQWSEISAKRCPAMRCCTAEGEVREMAGLRDRIFRHRLFGLQLRDVHIRRWIAWPTWRGASRMREVHFNARGLGWSCWLCEDLLAPSVRKAGAADPSTGRGMRVVAQPPGMYADRIWPREPAAARTSSSAAWKTTSTRFDFADVASVVFALPFTFPRRFMARNPSGSTDAGYVGYDAEKAVSIVSTVVAGSAVGIYSLGTLPQHQR